MRRRRFIRHPIEESPRDAEQQSSLRMMRAGPMTSLTSLRDDSKMRNQSRGGRARRLAASSIAVTLVATALIVTYFRADEDRYLEQVEQRLKKSDALLQEAKAAQAMTANAETKDRYLEQVEQRLKKSDALLQEAKAA